MMKGFACNDRSASPVTYEDQLRQTSNDLKRHASLRRVSMVRVCVSPSQSDCMHECVFMCAAQTTYKNQIEPIKTIGTGENAEQD